MHNQHEHGMNWWNASPTPQNQISHPSQNPGRMRHPQKRDVRVRKAEAWPTRQEVLRGSLASFILATRL